jgi:hypothetical protein
MEGQFSLRVTKVRASTGRAGCSAYGTGDVTGLF